MLYVLIREPSIYMKSWYVLSIDNIFYLYGLMIFQTGISYAIYWKLFFSYHKRYGFEELFEKESNKMEETIIINSSF